MSAVLDNSRGRTLVFKVLWTDTVTFEKNKKKETITTLFTGVTKSHTQ